MSILDLIDFVGALTLPVFGGGGIRAGAWPKGLGAAEGLKEPAKWANI